MEAVISGLALSALYIMSNQSGEEHEEENVTEGFSQIEPRHMPIEQGATYPVVDTNANDHVGQYHGNNTVSDKYYDARAMALAEAPESAQIESVLSLTGQEMQKHNFVHNNMVPFFGAKIKGSSRAIEPEESVLENMQGAGSQLRAKSETAPLFAPEANMNFIAGAPNNSDFYQSRVVPGARAANTKPWEEIQVGPGLGQGFSCSGSGGFNSGNEVRDMWEPKTVDELRVATNPKLTYTLDNLEGPAISDVKNIGILGTVEKQLPEKFYNSGPERWFTTTGAEKATTVRSEINLGNVQRGEEDTSYYGVAAEPREASYVSGKHEASKRQSLGAVPLPAAAAAGSFSHSKTNYGKDGYSVLPNNRSTTDQGSVGFVSGAIKAAFAPFMDALKPTRKENVIGNLRPNGNVSTTVVMPPAYNPADRAPTTIRETTGALLDNNHLNVGNQQSGAYAVSQHEVLDTQRVSTNVYYNGTAGSYSGDKQYSAAYNQRNNMNKSYESRPNPGGSSQHQSYQNVNVSRLESDMVNGRDIMPTGGPALIPSKSTHGTLNGRLNLAEQDSGNRINSDLLSAFKSNPYTQSLNSVY